MERGGLCADDGHSDPHHGGRDLGCPKVFTGPYAPAVSQKRPETAPDEKSFPAKPGHSLHGPLPHPRDRAESAQLSGVIIRRLFCQHPADFWPRAAAGAGSLPAGHQRQSPGGAPVYPADPAGGHGRGPQAHERAPHDAVHVGGGDGKRDGGEIQRLQPPDAFGWALPERGRHALRYARGQPLCAGRAGVREGGGSPGPDLVGLFRQI